MGRDLKPVGRTASSSPDWDTRSWDRTPCPSVRVPPAPPPLPSPGHAELRDILEISGVEETRSSPV